MTNFECPSTEILKTGFLAKGWISRASWDDMELHSPHAVCVRIHKRPSKESKFSSAPPFTLQTYCTPT
jgi:hypothetical protein